MRANFLTHFLLSQSFGSLEIAQRSLDIYTAALLRESFVKRVEPKKEWRDEMQRVSDVSCAAYRHTVREDPRFVPYFRQATPELELGRLNIGSRPAKRNPKGGVESLRAIPWTFAWAQTRMHLSAWLGVGAGLNSGVSCLVFMSFIWNDADQTLISLLPSRTTRTRESCAKCMKSGRGSVRLSLSFPCSSRKRTSQLRRITMTYS